MSTVVRPPRPLLRNQSIYIHGWLLYASIVLGDPNCYYSQRIAALLLLLQSLGFRFCAAAASAACCCRCCGAFLQALDIGVTCC